jgi:hypothetical protein
VPSLAEQSSHTACLLSCWVGVCLLSAACVRRAIAVHGPRRYRGHSLWWLLATEEHSLVVKHQLPRPLIACCAAVYMV